VITFKEGNARFISRIGTVSRNAVVHLGSVGGGEEVLLLDRESNGMVSLLERSGGTVGVSIQQQSMFPHAYCKEINANSAILRWKSAPDPLSGDDTPENLNPERLRRVGEIVNLALIPASRQYRYWLLAISYQRAAISLHPWIRWEKELFAREAGRLIALFVRNLKAVS